MLFCSSIVKVVMIVLLCAALCAVTTFITQVRHTSKRILKRIDVGEGTAMKPGARCRRLRQVASDCVR
jgi:LPS O-antigen subunit length determinant protein (WzzB/FepE family)